MKPIRPSAPGGYPEHNGHFERVEQAEQPGRTRGRLQARLSTNQEREQEQLDALLEAGFAWEEAITLLSLRERLYENAEMRQRMTDDPRLNFARWLYLNGEIDEGEQE